MRGTDPIKSSWVYPNSENREKFFSLNLYLIYKFYIYLRLPSAAVNFNGQSTS